MKRKIEIETDQSTIIAGLNFQRLYSGEKPDPEEVENYCNKALEYIPKKQNGLKVAVLLTGSAPLWLAIKVCLTLVPKVDEVLLDVGTSKPYILVGSSEKCLIFKRRKED